ncbi:MAG: homoserine dehydrogenase [Elusimicrobia bacterium]|nr:homoserine dehydrogenase [Candidatus Liberimonas magnetica]
MNEKVKLGLIGCGTVGQGVLKILEKNKKAIEQRAGANIEISGICDLREVPLKSRVYCTKNYKELVNNPDIDIIVELIGGYEPAKTIILESLRAGKNIITANKAVLAKYWDEIFCAARRYNRLLYFEASVAGAIPVVQVINEGLAANKIEKISGILNGTSNYILSEMSRSGISFEVALDLARSAGFAEANPSFDINGIDTAHKLSILSSLAWSSWVKLKDIEVTGIADISADDIYFVQKEFNCVVKLLGLARLVKGKLELSVEPCLVSRKNTFSNVEREYNAVLIRADSAGDIILYGRGAGQFPAASAVVSDIIFLSRHVANGTAGKIPFVSYDPSRSMPVLPGNEKIASYYLRFNALDKPGVLAKISGILGKYNVSIATVYQKEPLPRLRKAVPVLMVTHKINKGNLNKAIEQIDKLPIIIEKTVKFKIEE